MKYQIVSRKKEKQTLQYVFNHYTQQHLQSVINTSPYLKTRKKWNTTEPFLSLLLSTLQSLINSYPEKSYSQLQHVIESNQLPPAERHALEKGLLAMNQRLIADNQRLNDDKKIWYKNDLKAYLKHPFKRTKPDRSRYKSLTFTLSDSPFTLDHAVNILALTFQALTKEKERLDFRFTEKLPPDKELDRQGQAVGRKTAQLEKDHDVINDKTYDLLAKEAELKRELEQLKHLTRIAKGYTLSESPENLTSPAEQIEALEKLLAQKRRG